MVRDEQAGGPGLRERKRRETRQRITDAGIALFIARGYDDTTVEQIAEAAGISRRTFFGYFRSKDDVLLSLQSGMGDLLAAEVRQAPPSARPLDAIRAAAMKVCAAVPPADMIAIDRLMRSSAAVQASKQASYVRHEETLFAALRERWPAPERAVGLRLVAMLAVGAMRLATESFGNEGGERTIGEVLDASFDALAAETDA